MKDEKCPNIATWELKFSESITLEDDLKINEPIAVEK